MFSDEVMTPLCATIGSIVIKWSFIEQPIDICVTTIYHHCGGKIYALNGKIPRSMTTKVKFLNKCFKKIDCLLPFKDQGLSLIARASKIAIERNDIIHMRLGEITPDKEYIFYKLDYTRNVPKLRKLTFTLDRFQQFENKMQHMLTEIALYCQSLSHQFALVK